jgi:hypothetical protein
MEKPIYTEEIHIKRLIEMLDDNEPCTKCPATENFNSGRTVGELWEEKDNPPCHVCLEFVGIPKIKGKCPCSEYGEDVIAMTIKILMDRGYM